MDKKRFDQILERPGACTMDNVTWLCQLVIQLQEELAQLCGDDFIPHNSGDVCVTCNRPASRDTWPYCALCAMRHQRDYAASEVAQLQADYAEEKIRCFKVEQNLDECRSKLAQANHRAVSWSRKVMPG